jgi:DNA-directed RNA polymerase beta subunit
MCYGNLFPERRKRRSGNGFFTVFEGSQAAVRELQGEPERGTPQERQQGATMAQTQTFNGRRRVRKFFGKIPEVAEMPNLIEVQKASYDQFLMVDEPKGGRPDEGLQTVFKSVFPISDFSGSSMLEFVKYEFEAPKFDVDECRQRDLTYAAPLKVTLRLIVFDIDEDTGAKSIKDIKEQDADAPLAGRLLRP